MRAGYPAADQEPARRSAMSSVDPRVPTMNIVCARCDSGAGELGVPLRAAVVDPGDAVVLPAQHFHRLADVERCVRRGRPGETPAMRDHRAAHAEYTGDGQLHRDFRAGQRGEPARGERDAHREQVERAGHEFRADQHGREHPPDPVVGHRRSSIVRHGRTRSDQHTADCVARRGTHLRGSVGSARPRPRRLREAGIIQS